MPQRASGFLAVVEALNDEIAKVLQARGVDASPRDGELTHRAPQLPVLLDGKTRVEPGAVRRFAGQPLHTVVDTEAAQGEVLRVYTDQEKAKEYLSGLKIEDPEAPGSPNLGLRSTQPDARSQSGPHPPISGGSNGPPGGVPPNSGYIDLYEHVDWGGAVWRVREWERVTVPDFTKDLKCCGFLAWGWVNANDKASSVDCMVSGNAPWVVLWEHINQGGSSIGIWGRSMVSSLVPYGWNDRASSLQIWYF
jgi:hypothetical protein